MCHLLANLLDDKDYSDKQIREVAKNMGTSIDMIKRNYTDKKDTGFDVNVLEDEPKNKWEKRIKNKNTLIYLLLVFLIVYLF